MRVVLAAAAWVLFSSFPQGELFRRPSGGRIDEMEARGTFDAPPAAVREVVLHPSRFERLMPYLEDEHVVATGHCIGGALELPGCDVVWVYNRIGPPMVSARDYTLRTEVTSDALGSGGAFRMAWTLANERGPAPAAGVVRMPVNSGSWELSVDGTRTAYVYRMATDPGGSIPAWLVTRTNGQEIPKMLASLERAAQKLAVDQPKLVAPSAPAIAPPATDGGAPR